MVVVSKKHKRHERRLCFCSCWKSLPDNAPGGRQTSPCAPALAVQRGGRLLQSAWRRSARSTSGAVVSCFVPRFLQSSREPLFFRRVTSGAGSFRGAAVSIQGERCGGRAGRYSCSRRITRRPGTPNPYPRRSATFGVPILLAQVRVCSPRRRPPHLSRFLKIRRGSARSLGSSAVLSGAGVNYSLKNIPRQA